MLIALVFVFEGVAQYFQPSNETVRLTISLILTAAQSQYIRPCSRE